MFAVLAGIRPAPALTGQMTPPSGVRGKYVAQAKQKGLDWLTKNQAANGSWGKTYTIAVTSFACLAYLSAADEPFDGEPGKALLKGLQFLLAKQKDGMFPQQGHTWIHGQGFATLALSEAYGRSLLCKVKPDLDMKKVRRSWPGRAGHRQEPVELRRLVVHAGRPEQHEGSTTVCAVQAIVSADNFGIDIDQKVLDNGFEYLKKCQTQGGRLQLQAGRRHQHEGGHGRRRGHAGPDEEVRLPGDDQRLQVPAEDDARRRSARNASRITATSTAAWACSSGAGVRGRQGFHAKREPTSPACRRSVSLAGRGRCVAGQGLRGGQEKAGYATAFATLTLLVPEGRLSIYNREPPKLPKE